MEAYELILFAGAAVGLVGGAYGFIKQRVREPVVDRKVHAEALAAETGALSATIGLMQQVMRSELKPVTDRLTRIEKTLGLNGGTQNGPT